MTDTKVLDAMMKMLERNPTAGLGPKSPPAIFHITDEKPFWADNEPIAKNEMNPRYRDRVDLFHQDLSVARFEKPRIGTCNNCGRNTVHAVETRIKGAMRVDGRCMSCGWDFHRAGLVREGS